jgi:hypothetical protein
MSQTETLLLVALGFAFALVLAMIFGFAIWSAANRWASYRRKREVPTTILDMQAEREGLRAQNAMTARRLEFLLEEARSQAAEKTAQVTRQRNRAIVMSKDLIAKDAEIASLRALAAELTAETNKRARIIAKLTGHEAVRLRSFDMPVPEGAKPFTVTKPEVPAASPSEIAADAAPLDRIKAKIAELNALSAQIADQQSPESRAIEATLAAREAAPEPLALAALRDGEATAEAVAEISAPPVETVEGAAAEATPEPVTVPPVADTPPPEHRMTLAEKFKALKDGVRS